MPRTYGIEEYQAKAAEKNMKFLGPLPEKATLPTKWQCLNCGTIHTKTFSTLGARERACTCATALQREAYTQLAADLGIVWVADQLLPPNTKVPTRWYAPKTKQEFSASYSDVKWRITNAIKEKIGLPVRGRGGAKGPRRAKTA